MKNEYSSPEIDLIMFTYEDIVCVSDDSVDLDYNYGDIDEGLID